MESPSPSLERARLTLASSSSHGGQWGRDRSSTGAVHRSTRDGVSAAMDGPQPAARWSGIERDSREPRKLPARSLAFILAFKAS